MRNRQASRTSGFTLAEVLAALLFMAIVVPVAVDAISLASRAGEIGRHKTEAMRVAERVLNESIILTNWNSSLLSGTTVEGTRQFNWTLENQHWPNDSMVRLLTAQVEYTVAGRRQTVRLETLVNVPQISAGISAF
jgi:hypothetical protein